MKKLKLQNNSYKELLQSFKDWLDILGYAESTVYYLPNHLQEFFYYLECKSITHINLITVHTIKNYYRELQQRANETRSGALSKSYLNKHQQALKKFKEYLTEHGAKTPLKVYLKSEPNPVEERLNILTQSEIKELFKATEFSHEDEKFQLRDKAILTILYSCGLRRMEAVSLNIKDVFFDKERIFIRRGKNYKQRIIPVNKYNLQVLEDYIFDGRIQFYKSKESEALFISKNGKRLQGMSFSNRLKEIVKATNNKEIAEKNITLHSLRHSIATHLLQQEVALETIKTFLGHSSLESTQIYTHIVKTLENGREARQPNK